MGCINMMFFCLFVCNNCSLVFVIFIYIYVFLVVFFIFFLVLFECRCWETRIGGECVKRGSECVDIPAAYNIRTKKSYIKP